MDDLPLSIPVRSVSEFLSCPVCMGDLVSTVITPCGHRFCQKCIQDCVDIHHKCPICNNPTRREGLCKDRQFDELIATINAEKEKSEAEYFEKLLRGASEADPSQSRKPSDPEFTAHFSPIESILKTHLKESLIAHERYFHEMKQDLKKAEDRIQAQFLHAKECLLEKALPACDTERELERLQQEMAQSHQKLDQHFSHSSQLLAQAYDNYLCHHIPSVSLLPVTVTIHLLSKGIRIRDVTIKPRDSVTEILRLISQHMEALGDRVVKFADSLKFYCLSPFLKLTDYEVQRTCNDIAEHGAAHPDVSTLKEGMQPVLQLALKPGSEVCVYGLIQCESDLPKQCFSSTFQKGNAVDYFSCKQCQLNWLCRSCTEVCHKEHEVMPYIKNHQPSWACCYCPKKKKCHLVQGCPPADATLTSL